MSKVLFKLGDVLLKRENLVEDERFYCSSYEMNHLLFGIRSSIEGALVAHYKLSCAAIRAKRCNQAEKHFHDTMESRIECMLQ